jgi:tetratricopeptide (TPR) repeat protein
MMSIDEVRLPSSSKAPAGKNLALLGCCILGAALYGLLALRLYVAHRFSGQADQASLMKAIHLEPRNADYHDLLGRYLLFGVENSAVAAAEIRQAVMLDPYNASYWLDLAHADLSLGAKQEEQEAIARALAVDPTTPDVAWSAANLYLFQGDLEQALGQYAIVLNHSPRLVHSSLSQSWHMLHSTDKILPILPPAPDVYLQFLHLLISEDEPAAAAQVWNALMHLNKNLDYHDGLFYVDSLLAKHEIGKAVDAWQEMAARSAELKSYQVAGNMITNGTFSQDILNSGFDWRYTSNKGSTLSLDRNEAYGVGAIQSVAIVYTGVGGDAGLRQDIAVTPGTLYRLSVWVKSDDLQAANGPTIDIIDAYDNKTYAQTDQTLGTTEWHEISKDFRSGPTTQLIAIGILRNPASTEIRGKFWIDNVTLRSIHESEVVSR